jgi:bifunctional non-homologous end joining protein LigD
MGEDGLSKYRRKRVPERTPEPELSGKDGAKATSKCRAGGDTGTFVIQEHHASGLHWDFRLERDGVLVSWAVPKGRPPSPDVNHLAVRVEDHPLEHGGFAGTIPKGEYGAGTVTIWDHGTYRCEKWNDHEVMVVLDGERAKGRYVLFPTHGKSWMIHRMDPVDGGFEPLPDSLKPMLATAGKLPPDDGWWAYEFKWDGIRALVWVDGGRARARSRTGADITASFPEFRPLGEAMGSNQAVLEGELVVLDEGDRPSFSRLQHRLQLADPKAVTRATRQHPVSIVLFDLLHLNGHSLLDATYDQRRRLLEQLALDGPSFSLTPSLTDEAGADVLAVAVRLQMEGVVAKRRNSPYRPGKRSTDWIKVKDQRTQEVIIGGWTQGQGSRRTTFEALLLGIASTDSPQRLTFVGKVGTGFSQSDRKGLLARLRPLGRKTSPFDTELGRTVVGEGVSWASPKLVGVVQFTEWTPYGHLRHPSWRGLREDKVPADVRPEP